MTDDLLEQFLIEGRELTAQAGADLTALARAPGDRATLDGCFRAVHTLKGSAGLFDLPPMSRLLHVAEDRLDALRRGVGQGTETGTEAGTGIFRVLLEVIDQVDRWLDDLERSGALPLEAPATAEGLIKSLSPSDAARPEVEAGDILIRYVPRADAYFSGDDPVAIIAGVPALTDLRIAPREPFGDLAAYDTFTCNLVIEAVSSASRGEIEAALRWVKDQVELSIVPIALEAEPAGRLEGGRAGRTVRVEAARVDRLADITGDLVIAKNGLSDLAVQLEHLADGRALAQALRAQQARIDRLVADLHGTVSKIRLTPLAPLFGRFPRLVRQTAQSLGKAVGLEVTGGEIEVDKAVVDGLFEPLLHVLRNALDHGVATPDVRRTTAKSKTGVLRLAAATLGEQVVIEIADDGAGVDPERIRRHAVTRGLIDAASAERLDDRAALELIFLPGFSTASSVNEVSGRGVGMDAVRAAVSRLGGRVEVDSAVGQGTTVRFLLPISMVLTKVLVVGCGDERYGLALDSVVETVRVAADRIIPVRSGHAFQLRDQVAPLVALSQLVGVRAAFDPGAAQRVVVARVGDEQVGFAVDAIVGRMDAAVRPMSGLLANARGVVGSTLLADGAVLMILDLPELVA